MNMTPENMANLKKLAAQMQTQSGGAGADDDDVPDLVDNFEMEAGK